MVALATFVNLIIMDGEILRNIAAYQMLYASYNTDIGLFDGKMGIAIFFFHYARYSGLSVYEKFANELLDDVCEEVSMQMPITLGDGLCGIAWGITYLHKQGFIEGKLDEILSEIDEMIMERSLLRIMDPSWKTGFRGIALYISERLALSSGNEPPFDKAYIEDFKKLCSLHELVLFEDAWDIILAVMQNSGSAFIRQEERWQEGLKYMCRI